MPRPVFLGLSGGGVNGIAHLGVLMELQEEGYFDNTQAYFVGTSVGAFNFLGVALNYTRDDYLGLLDRIDFPRFMHSGGLFGYLNRFFGRFGAHSGRYICQLVNEEIERKTGLKEATFEELNHYDPSKHFYVIAVNISRGGILTIFSHQHTPKAKVADAIQASTAVPWYYSSVRFKENEEGYLVKDINGDHHIDGGVVDNFILHFFDSNRYVQLDPETLALVSKKGYNPNMLGVYLVNNEHQANWIKEDKKPPSIQFGSIFHYSAVVAEAIFHAHKNEALRNPIDVKRTIFANILDNPPFNFMLDQKTKYLILNSGQEACREHRKKSKESSDDFVEEKLIRARM